LAVLSKAAYDGIKTSSKINITFGNKDLLFVDTLLTKFVKSSFESVKTCWKIQAVALRKVCVFKQAKSKTHLTIKMTEYS